MTQLVSYLNELTVITIIDTLIGKMHIEIWRWVQCQQDSLHRKLCSEVEPLRIVVLEE